jgi:hypothetical protein
MRFKLSTLIGRVTRSVSKSRSRKDHDGSRTNKTPNKLCSTMIFTIIITFILLASILRYQDAIQTDLQSTLPALSTTCCEFACKTYEFPFVRLTKMAAKLSNPTELAPWTIVSSTLMSLPCYYVCADAGYNSTASQ